ncbi:MAG: phenylalanine--tRNA ligase subunit beta [Candidatus Manganitrophus sp.]|nr:phenylalanine--tRNA ligase subunit beta [Candidatus Manganitrophus sp.]WDT69416.1 MAG: phenylalanine--tRNA ligase subunit beta [Candidatus Manganitrophus sp.]WDT78998.1 MAG: phenylalanine--tRNA ligase subunit beta [Candidatus Manganitrophus sp.]
MPTIEIKISDFESLLGKGKISEAELETLLERVKGEVKEFLPKEDTAKIELNDSNRPDLWCSEGIARQVLLMESKRKNHPFFTDRKGTADRKVTVAKELKSIRPYLAACVARGMRVTDPILVQLIQTQEKLAEIFGRKRQTVSIGLYRLPKIVFPVRYEVADPVKTRFTPLGFDQPMSLAEILTRHPKGVAYAHTLKGADRYPILIDAKEQILSFPPIINSREIGEVHVGDSELFVEVTGHDLRMVLLALNIFAANLSDRGATIEPVTVQFPEETAFGREIVMPLDFSAPLEVTLDDFNQVLGEKVTREEVTSLLSRYGYTLSGEGKPFRVTAPPYRDDMMHPIDVIEDFVISRGIAHFEPEMPSTFTVGSLSALERLSDRLREEMVGLGLQEVFSNVLGSRQEFVERMRVEQVGKERPEGRLIEIKNPMTERFSILRPWLLPSLLRVESASSKAFYPHRIFEVGEVARFTPSGEETETRVHLAALMAHPTANFSELHAVLEAFFYNLSVRYRLEAISHPTFIEGRAGAIFVGEREAGIIGEIDPEVLTRWQIGMPAAAFEIDIESLDQNKKG